MKNSTDKDAPTAEYVLGHSDRELERLGMQARLLEPITREFFISAGIVAGMRILDVGSGAGDVAFLAADLAGDKGSVVGVDRAQAAVMTARRRAEARSLRNISFREGDAAEMTFEESFDAVVGRYVLLYQADAAHMLRQLARHLQPGGLIVFHEPDWSAVRSFPPTPTYARCCRWIIEAGIRGGSNWNMADKVHAAFFAAGLPAPTMRMQTFVGGGTRAREWLRAAAEIAATLLPAMEKFGVATAAEVDIATLVERMWQEVAQNNSVIFGRSEIGAWSLL
jgi:ubiquinone/menaquinone biosynthesis C-methylase UbiE